MTQQARARAREWLCTTGINRSELKGSVRFDAVWRLPGKLGKEPWATYEVDVAFLPGRLFLLD